MIVNGEKQCFTCKHYQTNYPRAAYQVIERDGIPIGRLYVESPA